ncbi:dipeptidyl peptidase 1-like [Schistocerca nitens]|uniref:dipeptidyl peptidase 1-like n=1 Tax=Schistocerca nitens TaxID=7011 RepID=UPI0021179660|nr:dipeptidyl peptidase 1-like [Schistocerca nitens]
MKELLHIAALAALLSVASAWTSRVHPNCSYADIEGSWMFYEGERNLNNSAQCLSVDPVRVTKVQLYYPNQATDQFGNVGTWTLLYNNAFEVLINGRKYFTFSYAEMIDNYFIRSLCNQTYPGWSYDVTLRHWSCFYGVKETQTGTKLHADNFKTAQNNFVMTTEYQKKFVREINSKQNSWKAKAYEQFNGKTAEEMFRMSGGRRDIPVEKPQPSAVTEEQRKRASLLPRHWDWRNVDGVNYVSPVRNQLSCGACYAFAVMGMLESRLRIRTNNTYQPVLSVQDAIDCSDLVGGCDGGYAYQLSRYALEQGVVEEQCRPYNANNGQCLANTCDRIYVSDYSFVGGYYGACNEVLMQEALLNNGPIAVGMVASSYSFPMYSGGIYRDLQISARSDFYPFEYTDHAVIIVGYGEDAESGEKYWIVKNSWGDTWGEEGYFRIRRGTNEASIESDAFEASPIP